MADKLWIHEIFFSIQGESTYAGLPCVFVRLSGCNLSCAFCDTPETQRISDQAKQLSLEEIVSSVQKYRCRLVEITGGEPMIQPRTIDLVQSLVDASYTVLLETNGTQLLDGIPREAVKIVDVKTPSSGEAPCFLEGNIASLAPPDQVKFVVSDRTDFDWAVSFLREHPLPPGVEKLFSAVSPVLDPGVLARWILEAGLDVRLQFQLHKLLRLP
jgi:7-carboxy-7-deazaguanine synthase